MKKGYMTVYLSLTLAVLLSFILTLVEGMRISATRMKAVCVADVCINSTLSEFNRELLEQYDLIFVDMTYGRESGGIESVQTHLHEYLYQNLDNATPALSRDLLGMRLEDLAIEEYALSTDNGGEAILRQVSDYMDTTLKGQFTSGLDDICGDLVCAGFDYDVGSKRSEVQNQIDSIKLPTQVNEEGVEEEVPLNNPADNVNAIRNAGILGMILSNQSSVSKTRINPSVYCSNRGVIQGNGISEEERSLGKKAGVLTYDEYLFDKLGYFGHEKEEGLLSYQIEYTIKHENSDWDNLEAICRNIVMWREAINFVFLAGDAERRGEAELIANTLAAVALCPELGEPVMWSILLAWAYVESLQDMKILIEGGGVSPFKTAELWHTPITALLHPRSALQSFPDQSGPKYGDYLKTLLLMTSFSTVFLKSLDVMEMDIRLTPGNSSFKIDYCLQSFFVDIVMNSSHGHRVEVRRRNGFYYA